MRGAASSRLMSFHNSVAIIASPRPRVGKTLLARLRADARSRLRAISLPVSAQPVLIAASH
jgi:hypothetical protein